MSGTTTEVLSAGDRWTGVGLRAFYFLFYGAVGVYVMFFAPYLRGLGFTGTDIGTVTVLGPFVGIAGTMAWTALADRRNSTSRVLRWCTVAALVPLVYLPFATSPAEVTLANVLHQVSAGACVPLIDALTYEWVTRHGRAYTRVRMWGAVGGLVVVQVVGLLLSARGDRPGDVAMPIALASIIAMMSLLAWLLPDAPPRDQPPNLRDWAGLARNRALQLFLLVCFLHWLCYAPYDLLYGVHLRELGLSSSLLALVLVGGSVSEAAMLYLFPILHRRLDVRPLLVVTIVVMAARWWLLAQAHGIVPIALLQVVHGAVTAMFWGIMVQAIGHIVPERLRTTGHGLFNAVVIGGGNTLGYWLAGIGYDHFGGTTTLFHIAAIGEALPLVLLLLVGARFNKPTSPEVSR